MVVLVTGAGGQLGQALQHVAHEYRNIQFYFSASAEADVTDKQVLSRLFADKKPHVCINTAAYTAVDKAESEQEKAFAVNVTGARNLAEVCNDFNAVLVHISTDFVFDGNQTTPYTEEDITHPQGVYGKTKRDGEVAIQETLKKYYIIRTSWLYSQFANNFMKTMIKLGRERDSLSVVNDQTGTPTYAVELAKAILNIIAANAGQYGIYHYSNEGEATWYDFAKKIFELSDITINLQPIPTTDYPTPAKRPVYSVLDKSKIKKNFGISIPKWEESLSKTLIYTISSKKESE